MRPGRFSGYPHQPSPQPQPGRGKKTKIKSKLQSPAARHALEVGNAAEGLYLFFFPPSFAVRAGSARLRREGNAPTLEQLSVAAPQSPGLPRPEPPAPPAPSASPGGPSPALTRSGGSAARTGEGGARGSGGSAERGGAGEPRRRREGRAGERFKPRGGQCETSGGGGCARLYPMPPRRPRAAAELGRVSRVGRRRGGCDTVTSAARQPCAGGGGPGQPRQRRPPAHGIDGAAVTHTRELVTGRHRAGGGGGSAPPPARPTANGAPRPGGLAGRAANGSAGRPPAAERPLRPSESSEDTPPPSAGEGRGEPRGAGPARPSARPAANQQREPG